MSKWPTVALGEVAEIQSGGTPTRSRSEYYGGRIPWATIADLTDGPVVATKESITEEGLLHAGAGLVSPDSVLVAMYGSIGKAGIPKIGLATNQAIAHVNPEVGRLDRDYLFHYVRSQRDQLRGAANGNTQPNISQSILKQWPLVLPSLSEQRRIAAILDQADALRSCRLDAITRLDNVLRTAFIELLGDPSSNPKGWPVVELGSMLASANYGTSEKASASGTFAVLRMNNITYQGALDLADLKYMELPDDKIERFTVRDGDILFNRTNSAELVGKTAVFRGDTAMAYAGYLIRLRTDSENAPDYMSHFLNSRYGKAVLRNMCKSIVGMANINAREVQAIKIPQPPKQLQLKFADMVRQIDEEKDRHQKSLAQLDALFASLQSRAFAGEL